MVIDGITARWGAALGKGMKAEDSLWKGLYDTHIDMLQGQTAEKLAAKYGITRQQSDEYGLRSQKLYQQAHTAGVFNAEIAPVEVKGKKGMETVSADEHPRVNANIQDLQKLKSVFQENGVVTAGTASGNHSFHCPFVFIQCVVFNRHLRRGGLSDRRIRGRRQTARSDAPV
jgi:acetyl-CoA acyltransferase 2